MNKSLYCCLMTCVLFLSCAGPSPRSKPETDLLTFQTDSLTLGLDQQGMVKRLVDRDTGTDYLVQSEASPLMSVRVNQQMHLPQSARLAADATVLILGFAGDLEARIRVESKATHLSFELLSLSDATGADLIVWGPYPTAIKKTIGETVGVVRGEHYALGIQALNPKTLGGYPWQENDCMPQIDIFEQDDLSDLSENGKRHVLYRVEAAKPTDFGSSLQAYCRNRQQARVIENWNHDRYVAPAFVDGGVLGSKIALFGCPVDETLETIGAIEVAEGLPHPLIDGEWGKQARSASAAYLIMGFGEADIDRALDITQRAGLRYLYHPGPFAYWGHFKLKEKQFPQGIASMKRCVDKARAQGVMLGVHTLSNFITPSDPYVTPVPDARLARVGSSAITGDIDPQQTEIPIAVPEFFNQFRNNHLKTVAIGHELIRYAKVSDQAPWTLLDCQRAAFGTSAARHRQGDEISKLADHGYKVFLTNPELSVEVAQNIAALFNQTGLRQISFDGLEGNRSTGMGNYGEVLFTQAWYDSLSQDIQDHYIADASRTSHYFWHMYTRMNWGEPWYAGFRESQTEYRLKNQAYFQRNLMPGMLGWFNMTPSTSIEDIEWMLARSAAFNAGYAFCTSYKVLESNADAEAILGLLGQWERARMSGAFTAEQRQRMQDIRNEFHLETVSAKAWALQQVYSHKFKHAQRVRQPGEPLYSTFSFTNPVAEQPLQFLLSVADGTIQDIKLEIDNYKQISLPVTLNAGDTIRYTGGAQATVYSTTWQEKNVINMDASTLTVAPGRHGVRFDCAFTGGDKPFAKLELRLFGAPENIEGKL